MPPMAIETSIKSIEKAALSLQPEARAQLAHTLVQSIGDLSEEEMERLWLTEAERRDAEMESGTVKGILGDTVFERIRARHGS